MTVMFRRDVKQWLVPTLAWAMGVTLRGAPLPPGSVQAPPPTPANLSGAPQQTQGGKDDRPVVLTNVPCYGQELFDIVRRGDATFQIIEKKSHAGGASDVILVGPGTVTASYWLTIANRSGQPLRFSWPAYVFFSTDKKKRKDEGAGSLVPFYLHRIEPEPEALVEQGASVSRLIPKKDRYYLGDLSRPIPHDGKLSQYQVAPVPKGWPCAKLAEALASAQPPLADEHVRVCFALVAGTTPESTLKKMLLKRPPDIIQRMRDILLAAGLAQPAQPLLDEVEKLLRDTPP